MKKIYQHLFAPKNELTNIMFRWICDAFPDYRGYISFFEYDPVVGRYDEISMYGYVLLYVSDNHVITHDAMKYDIHDPELFETLKKQIFRRIGNLYGLP